MANTDSISPDEIAHRVIELTCEDRREERRDDTEIELTPGVRVDPAPLTYKGASVEVDHQINTDIQDAIIQRYLEHPYIECFSSSDIWSDGYRYWALKDTERTGV